MKVETDDPEGDWTQPGVYEVDPGVYRIPLPLPHDALRAVNVYAITPAAGTDADDLVVVDAGWNIPVARDTLRSALGALGRDLPDVRRFLVTHVHRDHYGQAVALRREFGMPVGLGEGERPTVEALTAHHERLSAFVVTLHRGGAFELIKWLQSLGDDPEAQSIEWTAPDVWFRTGDTIGLPNRTLSVVETPGHTNGHVVFVDDVAGLLFAGDHVLPHITPSIGFEPVPVDGVLGNYLGSLRLVREMPDRRLLPAHGPIRPSVHARVDELIDHHDRRLAQMLVGLAGDELTAVQCAARVGWTRRNRSFADLDEFNQMLAVGETGAHLDLLVAQGRATVVDREGVRYYAAA
jgi:glyoxylase-like metal-dependent hydrolase (beta-lactamase superfamily II)